MTGFIKGLLSTFGAHILRDPRKKKSRPHKYDTELLRLMFPLAQFWALFSFSYSR